MNRVLARGPAAVGVNSDPHGARGARCEQEGGRAATSDGQAEFTAGGRIGDLQWRPTRVAEGQVLGGAAAEEDIAKIELGRGHFQAWRREGAGAREGDGGRWAEAVAQHLEAGVVRATRGGEEPDLRRAGRPGGSGLPQFPSWKSKLLEAVVHWIPLTTIVEISDVLVMISGRTVVVPASCGPKSIVAGVTWMPWAAPIAARETKPRPPRAEVTGLVRHELDHPVAAADDHGGGANGHRARGPHMKREGTSLLDDGELAGYRRKDLHGAHHLQHGSDRSDVPDGERLGGARSERDRVKNERFDGVICIRGAGSPSAYRPDSIAGSGSRASPPHPAASRPITTSSTRADESRMQPPASSRCSRARGRRVCLPRSCV